MGKKKKRLESLICERCFKRKGYKRIASDVFCKVCFNTYASFGSKVFTR